LAHDPDRNAERPAQERRDVTLRSTIRVVALFEAFKGLVVLLVGSGLLTLVHKDVYEIAVVLIRHAHLNPASRYPHIFLDAAAQVNDGRLMLLAVGAAVYALVRLIEAYGLYFERSWAEVLAAASGAIYVPFEVYGLVHRPSWHHAVLLIVNLAIVAVMLYSLARRRKMTTGSAQRGPSGDPPAGRGAAARTR